MDLFDFFYDQGWAEGSSMGSMMLEEMRADGYVYAIYILREELKERGIFEREWGNLRWRSEFGYIFSYADEDISSILIPTCDKMRSVNLYMLIYILGLEDSPLKVFYMKKYLEFFSFFTEPKPGIDNGVKEDGTLWHHLAPYMIAYGAEALNYFTLIRYVLHGTCFEVDEESVKNIKKVLDAYKVTAYKNDITTTRISGRILNMKNSMFRMLSAYAMTALCGDLECAAMFKTILDENADTLRTFYEGKLPCENIGRENFGTGLETQRKGISGGVKINDHRQFGYEIYPLPLDEHQVEALDFDSGYADNTPAFYRFDFEVKELCDTFLDTDGFGKGCVFVNGFNLGRFWEIGPQKRLYLPAPLLKKGNNTIIIFETLGKAAESILLCEEPDLG